MASLIIEKDLAITVTNLLGDVSQQVSLACGLSFTQIVDYLIQIAGFKLSLDRDDLIIVRSTPGGYEELCFHGINYHLQCSPSSHVQISNCCLLDFSCLNTGDTVSLRLCTLPVGYKMKLTSLEHCKALFKNAQRNSCMTILSDTTANDVRSSGGVATHTNQWKYDWLVNTYSNYRAIRSDGDGYFRAIYYSVFEQGVEQTDRNIFWNLHLLVSNAVSYSFGKFGTDPVENPLYHEEVQELADMLRQAASGEIWATVGDFEVDILEEEIDQVIIKALRSLLSYYIQVNQDLPLSASGLLQAKVAPGAGIRTLKEFLLQDFDAEDSDIEGYCTHYIEAMGASPESGVVELGLAVLALQCSGCLLFMDDYKDSARKNGFEVVNVSSANAFQSLDSYGEASQSVYAAVHIVMKPGEKFYVLTRSDGSVKTAKSSVSAPEQIAGSVGAGTPKKPPPRRKVPSPVPIAANSLPVTPVGTAALPVIETSPLASPGGQSQISQLSMPQTSGSYPGGNNNFGTTPLSVSHISSEMGVNDSSGSWDGYEVFEEEVECFPGTGAYGDYRNSLIVRGLIDLCDVVLNNISVLGLNTNTLVMFPPLNFGVPPLPALKKKRRRRRRVSTFSSVQMGSFTPNAEGTGASPMYTPASVQTPVVDTAQTVGDWGQSSSSASTLPVEAPRVEVASTAEGKTSDPKAALYQQLMSLGIGIIPQEASTILESCNTLQDALQQYYAGRSTPVSPAPVASPAPAAVPVLTPPSGDTLERGDSYISTLTDTDSDGSVVSAKSTESRDGLGLGKNIRFKSAVKGVLSKIKSGIGTAQMQEAMVHEVEENFSDDEHHHRNHQAYPATVQGVALTAPALSRSSSSISVSDVDHTDHADFSSSSSDINARMGQKPPRVGSGIPVRQFLSPLAEADEENGNFSSDSQASSARALSKTKTPPRVQSFSLSNDKDKADMLLQMQLLEREKEILELKCKLQESSIATSAPTEPKPKGGLMKKLLMKAASAQQPDAPEGGGAPISDGGDHTDEHAEDDISKLRAEMRQDLNSSMYDMQIEEEAPKPAPAPKPLRPQSNMQLLMRRAIAANKPAGGAQAAGPPKVNKMQLARRQAVAAAKAQKAAELEQQQALQHQQAMQMQQQQYDAYGQPTPMYQQQYQPDPYYQQQMQYEVPQVQQQPVRKNTIQPQYAPQQQYKDPQYQQQPKPGRKKTIVPNLAAAPMQPQYAPQQQYQDPQYQQQQYQDPQYQQQQYQDPQFADQHQYAPQQQYQVPLQPALSSKVSKWGAIKGTKQVRTVNV